MHRPVRITPRPPDSWDDATRASFAGVVPLGAASRPVRLPAVVAHQPALLAPYLEWAKAIALHGVLGPRTNAMLALRTGCRWGSEFEWAVHAVTASERAGLTDAELAAIVEGPGAPTWAPHDAALLRAVDELVDTGTITTTTWDALAAVHDDAALVELVLVVGHYSMLSMLANAVGLTPPEGAPQLLAPGDASSAR